MTHEFVELSEEREAQWFSEQQKIEMLAALPPEQLEPAFEHADGVCSCIDEGTNGDIRLAGSGILHPGGIEAVAELLHQQDVKEVTSHDHCGAADIAYRREHGLSDDADVAQTDVDAFAVEWSKRLAAALNVRYRNISAAEIRRPVDYHPAAVVYLDSVGHFRPDRVPELPEGFVITAHTSDRKNILFETQLAASLALGAHGFGEHFTVDSPLRIVMVGEVSPDIAADVEALVASQAGRVRIERLPIAEEVLQAE